MSLSGGLRLTDLNDFITPSQACIKPITVPKTDSTTEIKIDDTGDYYEVNAYGEETKLQTATITLNDCLACSGCITSAESMLVSLQSHKELYNVIGDNRIAIETNQLQKLRTIVVSISPQSRASLASKYNLTIQQVYDKLNWFFKEHLGVNYVVDTSFSRDFSLIESAKEFVNRYIEYYRNNNKQGVLPMVSSSCPGWICYAEKTHDFILPYIDTTKSPQQIMGSIIKYYIGTKLGLLPNQIYHVAVMPCYDKKLEASRPCFANDEFKSRDVDCVITTGEIEKMFEEQSLNIQNVPELPSDGFLTKYGISNETGKSILLGTLGSSSGGYLHFIMKYAAYHLFNIIVTDENIINATGPIRFKQGRNSDYREVHLVNPENENEILLCFVYAYGFRNIQNLVRKIKTVNNSKLKKPLPFHYVEVMACPSGCINGGGQLKSDDGSNYVSKEWIEKTENAYQSISLMNGYQDPTENSAINELYSEWLGSPDSEQTRIMLHTEYKAIKKEEVNALMVSW